MKTIFEKAAKKLGYVKAPPTIEEFLTKPYYIGEETNFGKSIFKYWWKKLQEWYPTPFFEYDDDIKIIIFTGGTGIGKSKISSYAFLYEICRILHMKNPQEKFKLPNNTKIIFALTNSTKEAAEQINFDPLMAIIKSSPFFVENYSKTGRTLFEKNIDIVLASRKRQIVGKDIIGAISDEVNQEVVKGGSFSLVTEMINRINSRFLVKDIESNISNRWPSKYFIISSSQTENSLIEKLKENFENFTGIKVIAAPRYEVLKDKINYSGKTFKVFIGNHYTDPFIIKNENELKLAKNIDPSKIFEVPIEHYQEFVVDIFSGIQDVIGKPTASSKTFLKSKEKINKALSINIGIPDYLIINENTRISKLIDISIFEKFNNKRLPRIIGLDIGIKKDRFGFSMIVRNGKKIISLENVKNEYNDDLKDFKKLKNEIENEGYWEYTYFGEINIAFLPEKNEIPLFRIREFINDLRDYGYNIVFVGADGYQSTDTLQILKNEGFDTGLVSVDKSKSAYYTLRNAIDEERIKLQKNEILREELYSLIETDKKIDHIEGVKSNIKIFKERNLEISKDIADSVASAIFSFHKLKKEIDNKEYEEEKLIKKLKVFEDKDYMDTLLRYKKEFINIF